MNWILTLAIVVLMGFVVYSLVRGIVAFLQTTKIDLENQENEAHIAEMHARQNKMMFNRVKYQALAIVAVVILLAINS
ncbi:HIG1 domain-containing protein [Alteraurantiacibacter aquimixticola]|uniref:Uncharacterized protein n=1 Tax=Alteraurantiacibacter aquimixticola TaxID=2489173 RepID=A0A4V6UGA2_9SPHN|nr:HIG1 domain-containing protein [Alteraurantiacibacter aquimixticola]TIX49410.1 hypothetical protein E5222_11165 [Alteraurantiacibacter aquimixticola]